jgi:hypothetical protein
MILADAPVWVDQWNREKRPQADADELGCAL